MRRYVLGIAMAVTSLFPALGMADDLQIADFIKNRLQAEQQRGNLKGFNVDMRVEEGVVTFSGHVSNEQQESLILTTAQQAGHLGVVRVVDDIEVMNTAGRATALQTASYQQVDSGRPAVPAQGVIQGFQQFPQAPQASNPGYQQFPQTRQAPPVPMDYQRGNGGGVPMAFASTNAGAPAGSAGPASPEYGMANVPMMAGGMEMGMAGGTMESPSLPGYAWPGYAAHPNYAAVTYPKQYSPSAWPYIGPFYPYPQVPLGWRKVSLQWDDGWWFLDFHDK